MVDLQKVLAGARVAVTGAAGTVGQELIRQLLTYPVTEIRALDSFEGELFLLGQRYRKEPRFNPFLADVREPDRLSFLFENIDFVVHAAAYKHVPLAERAPMDAVRTNILGVQNVIDAARAAAVRKVLVTSSDKAVNPTNVMGTSKLMGERLVTAANALRRGDGSTVFSSTRFGNVAGSSGSVIPLFCSQIEAGAPVTLTDADMTRFVMTVSGAVRLVLTSMAMAKGGEVFVTKMPVLRIADLARVMVDTLAPRFGRPPKTIEIETIGTRPGEKLFEELMSEEETRRAWETEHLFVVLPACRNIYGSIEYAYSGVSMTPVSQAYVSSTGPFMSFDEIESFLREPGVLPESVKKVLEPVAQ